MDRRMIHVHSNLAIFRKCSGNIFASEHLEVFQNNRFGILFVLQKKNANRNWSFCNVYLGIGATKTPFLLNEYTNASF